jgi:DNA-binding HxlR family transcriptional regulator
VARILDMIGERCATSCARAHASFGTWRRGLAGIGNTLSARLKRLEKAGIVERRFYEQHPPCAEYVLTEKGRSRGPFCWR